MSRSDIACFPPRLPFSIARQVACSPEYHAPNCAWCGYRVGPRISQTRRATIKRRAFIKAVYALFLIHGYKGTEPRSIKDCEIVLRLFAKAPAVNATYWKLWKDR